MHSATDISTQRHRFARHNRMGSCLLYLPPSSLDFSAAFLLLHLSALEVSTLRSPAPVALAAANAVGLEDPEGTYSAQEDSASGVGGGGDVDGGMKPGIRPLSGAPAGGERATKLARTTSDKKVEERGNDGSGGDGGGVKADGTGGGCAAKIRYVL